MKIDDDVNVAGAVMSLDAVRRDQPDKTFADMLDAERLKAEADTARSDVLAGQEAPKENPNKEDMAFIREHGLRAYAEEIHKKKLEELRQKLLEAMGLSEEALNEMPADQRLAIENMISREIQKRMAAGSVTNGESGPDAALKSDAADGKAAPGDLLAAHLLAGDPGSYAGLKIHDAATNTLTAGVARATEDDR